MAPIRVALIGLSAGAKTAWASTAHLPYLLSSRGKSHYEIVALLNTSIKSAEAAREFYGLAPAVKAYGDPAALAADPDVDLVVCNVRVDLHFPTVEPSVRAGKAVYVEWPLTDSLERSLTLTQDQRYDNSILGLQLRVAPVITKLKELLDSGRLGRVLSSNIEGYNSIWGRDAIPDSLDYFTQRSPGGNNITIVYAHMIDYCHEVLGEFDSFKSRSQIQRPTVRILDKDGSQAGTLTSDVPDFVAVHGPLAKGPRVVDGATLALTLRLGAPAFSSKPPFAWTINCEFGEILLTGFIGLVSEGHSRLNSKPHPLKIELHDHKTDEITEIEWDYADWQKELPPVSRSVGELYERYAAWHENGKPAELAVDQNWPRIHDAIPRHRELKTLFDQFDAQK